MAALSHSISRSEAQALPSSHLKISSVSEGRSTIDLLIANPSDAPFAFPDAPTLTSISKIVSTPDADSIRIYTRIESAIGSLHLSFNLLRASPIFHKLLRLLATHFDLLNLLRASSTFQFASFPRFLILPSSTLRALLRLCPSLLVLILNTSRPHSVIYVFNS
jgi:hypothetical protein